MLNFVEALSPLAVLVLTCVFLILNWLRLYDGDFTTIPMVIPSHHPRFATFANFHFCTQVTLASTSTCPARFGVLRSLRAFAKPNDDELKLNHQERWILPKDGALQYPGTRPDTCPETILSTRREAMASCSLYERCTEYENGRRLSRIINKAISGDAILWNFVFRRCHNSVGFIVNVVYIRRGSACTTLPSSSFLHPRCPRHITRFTNPALRAGMVNEPPKRCYNAKSYSLEHPSEEQVSGRDVSTASPHEGTPGNERVVRQRRRACNPERSLQIL